MEDSSDIFLNLYKVFDKLNKKEYNYLFEYYIVILLIYIYFVDFDKINNKYKIGQEILQILYVIISNEKNEDIIEFAFLLFCELHTQVEDISFQIKTPNKWCLLIFKLFIHIFVFIYFSLSLYDFSFLLSLLSLEQFKLIFCAFVLVF